MGHDTVRGIGFAIFLLFLTAGCGRNDAPVSPSQKASTEPVTASVSDGVSSGETASEPASQPAGETARAGRIDVRISPSFPSRVSPPLLLVEGMPWEKDREFREVVWLVNGNSYGGGDRIDPEWFRKGDRIGARGTVRVGKEEVSFETREVVAGNSPPEIGTVRLEPKAPTTGSKVKASATSSDPDDDPVTLKYQWFIDDREVPGEGEELTLAGVKKGSWVHVRVSTNDGAAEGSWKYSPKHQVVNSLPVVKSTLPAEVPPDRKFSYRIVAEDPDGDALTYDLVKSPPGMVLSGSTLEWDVPDEILGKMVEVVVNISDGDGGQTIC
ncbi:MAG: hypothetical protein WBA34_05515, partial [Candidatus Deferrimicrobiaceae bacterium]